MKKEEHWEQETRSKPNKYHSQLWVQYYSVHNLVIWFHKTLRCSISTNETETSKELELQFFWLTADMEICDTGCQILQIYLSQLNVPPIIGGI